MSNETAGGLAIWLFVVLGLAVLAFALGGCATAMVSLKSRSFPVISPDGQLLGIISREDVMRALKESTREAQ